MRFEWDEAKNIANHEKHGISFEEAKAVYESDVLELASEHSYYEKRFAVIGPIARGVVTVVHTYRAEDVIRLISARPATKAEKRMYRSYLQGK